MARLRFEATAPAASLLEGVGALVHAAYVRASASRLSYDVNVRGSTLLVDAAREAGVQRVVFLSSVSAAPGALSVYGRQKHALETLFVERKFCALRPGLVIGPGGLFASMAEHVRARRLIPLIDGGMQPLQTVFIDDLVQAVESALATRTQGVFSVVSDPVLTYRRFCEHLAQQMSRPARFVNVPYRLADSILTVAAVLRLPLSIDRESLRGLRAMRIDPIPHPPLPGTVMRDPVESIRLALEMSIVSGNDS